MQCLLLQEVFPDSLSPKLPQHPLHPCIQVLELLDPNHLWIRSRASWGSGSGLSFIKYLLSLWCCFSQSFCLVAKSCLTLLQPQAPLSVGFSRQECWSGLPFLSPRDLSNPGIKPTFPALADRFFTTEPPGKPIHTLLGPSLKQQVERWVDGLDRNGMQRTDKWTNSLIKYSNYQNIHKITRNLLKPFIF